MMTYAQHMTVTMLLMRQPQCNKSDVRSQPATLLCWFALRTKRLLPWRKYHTHKLASIKPAILHKTPKERTRQLMKQK